MSDQLRRLDKEHTKTLAGPVRRAVVRIEPSASEPAPGSVRPSAPIVLPEQRSGR